MLGGTVVQERLQDEHSSEPIHRLPTPADADFGLPQQTVSLHRGEPLVPEVNRQPEALAQLLREKGNLLGLGAFRAAHSQGVTHHDFSHRVFGDEAAEFRKIGSLVPAAESPQTLGRDRERVRDGNADGLGPYVQSQQPGPDIRRRELR